VNDIVASPPITEAYFVTGTVRPGWGVACMVQLGEGRLGFWDQIAGIVALLPTAEWESRPSESTDMRKVTHNAAV
jgi:hypothetical protein